MKKRIYFDHSATTPMDKSVIKAMEPYFCEKFGNASSIHGFGQEAMAGIDKARKQVADFLNCDLEEVYFTSGATESNNMAIRGLIKGFQKQGIKDIHVITSLIEHDAVLEPCMKLERQGIKVTHIPVDNKGVIDIKKFQEAISKNTRLVSIMYVNSEVGSIQPIREVGKIIKKINDKKLREWQKLPAKNRGEKPTPIYFHTDATQAVNFLDCNVKYLHCDLLSLSAHKIYGPKGVGALYVKNGVPIKALQLGGHQEKNLRSGTYNVSGIVGLGQAINLITKENQAKNNKKISKLRDLLVAEILKNIPNVNLNTNQTYGTPSHAHFTFIGVEGEAILISLDLAGIAVSTGSACASGSLKASHVLLAMGIRKEIAHNSIRFTLGKNNTEEEIKKVAKILPPLIQKLRKMNPLYQND